MSSKAPSFGLVLGSTNYSSNVVLEKLIDFIPVLVPDACKEFLEREDSTTYNNRIDR